MKGVISLVAVVGAFLLVLLGGGSAAGLWKELKLPGTSAADRAARALAEKREAKREAAKERRVKAREKARRAAKARWVREANRVCRQAKGEIIRKTSPTSFGEVEAMVSRLGEVTARYNARLVALPPPPGQRAKIRRLKRIFAKEQILIERLRDALLERNPKRILAVSERLIIVSENGSQIMYDLGALRCAL